MNEIKLYKFNRKKYGAEQRCDAMEFKEIKQGILSYPIHRESFYCFILVESGEAILSINGIQQKVGAGTLICGLPGEIWDWNGEPGINGKTPSHKSSTL